MNQNPNNKQISQKHDLHTTIDVDIDDASVENESCHSEESGESSSFCRHCLRPQSELQMHYLRTRQRSKLRQRKNQKQRHEVAQGQCNNNKDNVLNGTTKRKRSKQRSSRRNNKKCADKHDMTRNMNPAQNLPISTLVACDTRSSAAADLNAANAEVIRFRCPQVGPLLGHNVSVGPMHFHHPMHQQQHHYAYQQYQQYQQQLQQQQHLDTCITIESEKKLQHKKAKRPNCRNKQQQTLEIQTITRGTTLELPLVKTAEETIDIVAESGDNDEQLESVEHEGDEGTVPDSPSLVKVHTWYTVAKQGVSC